MATIFRELSNHLSYLPFRSEREPFMCNKQFLTQKLLIGQSDLMLFWFFWHDKAFYWVEQVQSNEHE